MSQQPIDSTDRKQATASASDELERRVMFRREAMINRLEELSRERGLTVFEGRWHALDEVRRLYRRMRARQYLQFFEVICLVNLVLAAGLVLGGLLYLLYW